MFLISLGSGFYLMCIECSYCVFGNGYYVGKIFFWVLILFFYLYGFCCVVVNLIYSKIKDVYLIFEFFFK